MSQTLRTDLYQLTMMQAYWSVGYNPVATFDYFVRKPPFGSYLLTAGLDYVLGFLENLQFSKQDLDYLKTQGFDPQFLKYLQNFHFTGDIWAMPEGSLAFPIEPMVRVSAPVIESQFIETYLLNRMNFSTLIATKASRVVYAAKGRPIAEFGLRRAQGDACLEASRAAYIGGCATTSHVEAGQIFGIPVTGTMAHSFVTCFDQEIEAFRVYAATFPKKCYLLIDTYNTLEGARQAAIVGKELERKGEKLLGVRIDSGNLHDLAGQVRQILDAAGLSYAKIVASGDLNEWKVDELCQKGAKIDMFGVGTELVTARPNPALDGIYKLCEIITAAQPIPKMKLSEDAHKATLPGKKKVWRLVGSDGKCQNDVIALDAETIPHGRPLLEPVVQGGKIVYQRPALAQIREYAAQSLHNLPDAYRQLDNGPTYPVKWSPALASLKEELTKKLRP